MCADRYYGVLIELESKTSVISTSLSAMHSQFPKWSLPSFSNDSSNKRSRTGSRHALVVTEVQQARNNLAESATVEGPLYLSRVEAGFPSPADDYVKTELDLTGHLVRNEEATFFVRVSGDSMTDVGIHDGDIIVVDRSVEPESGDVVVAALDTELTVKRYEVHSGHPCLMPESKDHDPIPVREGQELVVWGVVQHVIHEVS